MSDRKPYVVPWIAGIVLVLIGGYVGSYYWMVKPSFAARRGIRMMTITVPWSKPSTGELVDVGKGPFDRFFAPMNWVDRQLRPDTWKMPPIRRGPPSEPPPGPYVWPPPE